MTADSRVRTPFFERLHPEFQEIIERFPEGQLDIENIQMARAKTAELMRSSAAKASPVPGVAVRDEHVRGERGRPDLRIRLYNPDSRNPVSGGLFFIHGGGFVMGEVEHFDAQCEDLAKRAGCLVASLEYRLAPEYPYPVPLEDCYAGLLWLAAQHDRLRLDVSRIAVGGTSAGAGLAAGLALLARDRGELTPAFQLLEAPMIDHRSLTPASQYVAHPKVWNTSVNTLAWRAYLGDVADTEVPAYASPALAADLRGLPPAYISVTCLELFADEALDYARRLIEADVAVELHVYPNGFHGSTRAVPEAELSRRWRADTGQALAAALAAETPSPRSEES